ncbi:hypothetical protein LEP1GSC193_3193 [Leptospira alstonii serovar Pingchang str. 80-412]|uniref:Uncharacterized protein n=2 Tax=Leptospira alstonii TaxID=28452 RepID=M6D4L5_9LEPT|nr:hypothetical protein LEP1GSC194_2973 [Leptospira alstonii serovar Sichuan str. 79601]EQA79428.1 hypothetical protein LEP1GSC193_3193 [Leptospira alstonii serovar Pingchang str. 80-412]
MSDYNQSNFKFKWILRRTRINLKNLLLYDKGISKQRIVF